MIESQTYVMQVFVCELQQLVHLIVTECIGRSRQQVLYIVVGTFNCKRNFSSRQSSSTSPSADNISRYIHLRNKCTINIAPAILRSVCVTRHLLVITKINNGRITDLRDAGLRV